MIGTLVNVGLIIAGSLTGVLLSKRTKIAENKIYIQIMGVFGVIIGIQSAGTANTGTKFVITMSATVLGAFLGELFQLDQKVEKTANQIESYFLKKIKNSSQTREEKTIFRAFITSTLLYCVGPFAIIGSLQDGLKHDPSLLITKAILDGTTSIALAASMGIGVLFSAIPILLYQGGITLLAEQMQPILTPAVVDGMSSVGGVLLLITGLNLIGVTKISVINLMPGIILGGVGASLLWS